MTAFALPLLGGFALAGIAAGTLVLLVPRYRSRLYGGKVITRLAARLLNTSAATFRNRLRRSASVVWIVSLAVSMASGLDAFAYLSMATIAVAQAPYIDDLLTGGDDRWRRRWRAARNRLRWRMRLPVPARTEPGTALVGRRGP